MKKILLLTVMVFMLTIFTKAQLPNFEFFRYEFTNGSGANTATSGATDLVGNFASVTDRNNANGAAARVTTRLLGSNLGAANVTNTTLSFWIKHNNITSNQRILQIYGSSGGNGYRVEMDGTRLAVNAKASTSSGFMGDARSDVVNIDDNQWHNIIVRTEATNNNNVIEFDAYLDGVLLPNISSLSLNPSGGVVTNFLKSARFEIDPLINNYDGFIDDVYLYLRAVNNTEISQLYNYYPECIVNIPDANFKNIVTSPVAGIDTNNDGEIQCGEATAYTGGISVFNSNISDLTGIEAFTNITSLNCRYNQLTSLNLSANTKLTDLICNNNQLTSLYLSNNSKIKRVWAFNNALTIINVNGVDSLEYLSCDNNQLTNIDVTGNSELATLYLSNNMLTSLDLTNNAALVNLTIGNNSLSTLDLSANVLLEQLWCSSNQITALDLSNNIELDELFCGDNMLTTLDVSNNTKLVELFPGGNSIGSLDLSDIDSLEQFECQYCELTSLNIANGNNTSITFFGIWNNLNLTCIQVDDTAYSNANWTNIDPQHFFSEDCTPTIDVTSITVQGQGGVSTITTNGGTLQMEAMVLPTNATDGSYTWSVNNGTGSATIGTNGLLTATTNGIVTVTATANDGSGVSGSADITISNQGADIDNVVFENLSIYPNPTNDIINIEVQENLNSIQLFDITGKRIQTFHAQSKQLDVSTIKAGIYFLEIANSKKKSVIKIIKR